MSLYLLNPDDPHSPFPCASNAEKEPNGLLALGGDLSPERLLNAYHSGIFPWYNHSQPIMWWSPDPRTLLFPDRMHISRSLRKTMRNCPYQVSIDQAFPQVIQACAELRSSGQGTWITREMRLAYERLHRQGHAHSVEIWQGEQLVGGLYGVLLGQAFFGESMFSRVRDSSKIALAQLAQHFHHLGGKLIDCQVKSPHLITLGAEEVARTTFIQLLKHHTQLPLDPPDGFAFQRRDLQMA